MKQYKAMMNKTPHQFHRDATRLVNRVNKIKCYGTSPYTPSAFMRNNRSGVSPCYM